MKSILILVTTLITMSASAETVPYAVRQAAAQLKKEVRTVITKLNVPEEEANGCVSVGVSYDVELQVKQAAWDGMKKKTVYTWETVRKINVEEDGSVMEACGE